MKKVTFEYSLKYDTIYQENKIYNLPELSIHELKRITIGKIFIFFLPQRNFIVLNTGIIDYLQQFKQVFKEVDSGNFNTFSVSCDWYSNNLSYIYDDVTKTICITETNGQEFEIITDYRVLKKSFIKFWNEIIKDLITYYPQLKLNNAFMELITH